jgi:hypothetical protein
MAAALEGHLDYRVFFDAQRIGTTSSKPEINRQKQA